MPPLPDMNAHYVMNPPEAAASPADHLLYIDVTTGRKMMKKEFFERVYDGATALATPPSMGGLGLDASNGELIGILSHNCIDFITLLHALLVIATPFALIPAHGTSFELVHILRTVKPTKIFVHASLLDKALAAAKEVGFPADRFYILEGEARGRLHFSEMIEEVRKRKIPRVPVKAVTKDTLAYLILSSGTSGLPKAVMISHGNTVFVLAQAAAIAQCDGMVLDPKEPNIVTLAFLPFYHSYGLSMLCMRGFMVPQTFIILSRWDINLVMELIPRYRISFLLLIPSAIHQLVNHKDWDKLDLSSVKALGYGAAHTPTHLAERFGKRLPQEAISTEAYGQSELTIGALRQPIITTLGGRIKPDPESCGILLPGYEARLLRADGSEADFDEPGLLLLRSPGVALGYWNNEKATKETFLPDGWLNTGDSLRVDREGRFYFVERMKDTLKISGLQVSPTEIEDALIAHPGKLISDVCVAGVSGGRTSDEKVPRAWIVLSDAGKKAGGHAVIEALEKWSKENLSKYKWLRGGFEIVDAIPKLPTGKALRRTLVEQYEHTVKAKL